MELKQETINDFKIWVIATFRREILQAGLNWYNKILEADRDGINPIYRSKEQKCSAQGLEVKKKRKSKKWLGDIL